MKQKQTVRGVIRLSRYKEYWLSVLATTLLGAIFSGMYISSKTILPLVLIYIANVFAVCFTFMINDIEDAADDALNPDKVNRNPISAGFLRRRNAYAATMLVALASIVIYYFFPPRSFLMGFLTIFVGTLYSWKGIRLKSMPVLDLISHGLMLAGFQFAATYFTFVTVPGFSLTFLLPFFLIVTISMYGELFNEVRDFTYDEIAGVNHTASFIGRKNATLLMYILLVICGGIILYAISIHMIPIWFILLIAGLAVLFVLKPFLTMKKTKKLEESNDLFTPVMGIGTIGFIVWLVINSL